MTSQAINPAAAMPRRRPPRAWPGLGTAIALLAMLLASALPASAQQPLNGGKPDQLDSAAGLTPIAARNALSRADYSPNLIGFQTAVEAGDLAAIPLYQAAGLELPGNTVRAYVNPLYRHDDNFDPVVAKLLLAGGVDRDAFCLDDSGQWDHYFVTERRLDHPEARVGFIRGLCATDETRLSLRALYDAERFTVAAQQIANDQREADIEACAAAYMEARDQDAVIAEAADNSFFDLETVSAPHDAVLMELSSWHIAGQKTPIDEVWPAAVRNGCASAFPAHVVHTAHRDRLEAILTLLGDLPAPGAAPTTDAG